MRGEENALSHPRRPYHRLALNDTLRAGGPNPKVTSRFTESDTVLQGRWFCARSFKTAMGSRLKAPKSRRVSFKARRWYGRRGWLVHRSAFSSLRMASAVQGCQGSWRAPLSKVCRTRRFELLSNCGYSCVGKGRKGGGKRRSRTLRANTFAWELAVGEFWW